MKRKLSLVFIAFFVALLALSSCNQNPTKIADSLATKVSGGGGTHSGQIRNSKLRNYVFFETHNTAENKNYFVAYRLDSVKERTGTGSGNYWWTGTKWSVYREAGKINSTNDVSYHYLNDSTCEFWTTDDDVVSGFDTLIIKSYVVGPKKGSFILSDGLLIFQKNGISDTVGPIGKVLMMKSPVDSIELIGMANQDEIDF